MTEDNRKIRSYIAFMNNINLLYDFYLSLFITFRLLQTNSWNVLKDGSIQRQTLQIGHQVLGWLGLSSSFLRTFVNKVVSMGFFSFSGTAVFHFQDLFLG